MIFFILPDKEKDADQKRTEFGEEDREPQSVLSHDQGQNKDEDDMEEEGSHKRKKSGDKSIIEIGEERGSEDIESREIIGNGIQTDGMSA